ncbi:MAG: HAD family hydrolase [Candidatus Dormibacteria bacterium]
MVEPSVSSPVRATTRFDVPDRAPDVGVAMPVVAPPLVVRDLLADLVQITDWLAERLAAGDWLDAYLLAAGAAQIAEDYSHRDVWSIRRIATALARYRFAGRLAWLLCALAAGVELIRRLSPCDRRLTRWVGRVAAVRNQLAFVVLRTPSPFDGGLTLLAEEFQRIRAALPRLPAGLHREVLRLPSCFRSFDQHPADCVRLAENFARQAKRVPAIIVGVRTSGSYLAPLVAAALADDLPSVEILTVRPGRPLHPAERAVLDRAARWGGHVLVVDDPPVSGEAVREVVRALRVPDDLVTLLIPSFDGELPKSLRRHRAVILPFGDWAVHTALSPHAVQATLTNLIGSRVCRVERLALPVKDAGARHRGHVSALYRVEVEQSDSRLVMVSGAGLGYFGRHAVAVAQAVPHFVPRVYGFRDGLLFREWLPEAHRLDALTPDLADQVAAYIAARGAALPAVGDHSRNLAGRTPVWEVASRLIANAFGRLGIPLQPLLLNVVARQLTGVRRPSVIDGDTGLHKWFYDGVSARTITPDVRAFSNRDLACYDPAYDVAGTDPGGRHPHVAAVRRHYEARTGQRIDDERLLLYQLVHLWDRARNGHLTESRRRRASARVVQRYLGACYLDNCPEPCEGPIVALDCDGVLETDPLGYPATTPAGALTLRSLQRHGYRPVLVTGRSLDEVRERCENYHLSGGVAEYGSIVYRHDPPEVIELTVPQQRAALDGLRESLAATRDVQLDADYAYVVRAFSTDSRGQRHGLRAEIVSDVLHRAGKPPAYVIHGQSQTDFVANGIDKGHGLKMLAHALGSPGIALAVGDTVSDLPMLRLAHTAYLLANATLDARISGIPVLRQPYQTGLSVAVARLLGHRPGECPSCQPPAFDRRSRLLLAVLAAPEAGSRGLPGRISRTAFALLATKSEVLRPWPLAR